MRGRQRRFTSALLLATSLVCAVPPAFSQDDPPALADPAVPFGRSGPLTQRERAMAETAWSYFVLRFQEETGLVNAVGSYPSTTMWDTGSYVSALVSAYELGIIDKREFDRRANLLISTLRNLSLFRGELPNKVYNTETGAKVNYANQPGEVGFSVLDIGRLLVWLKIMKERYPYLANSIDNIPMRWNYCNLANDDGRLFGSLVSGNGETRYVQEGRLGYEEYAAKGFALWGFDPHAALEAGPYTYTTIYDIEVPVDARDPRIFNNQNYVLTEGYLLDGLELGWDLPNDKDSGPGLASHGWRAEFANRIYLVQQRRFERTGILTARSEHQVEGAPYFVYDTIFADGYPWNTLDPSDVYQPDRAAIAAKAAVGMWALWETPYTDLLFESVADLSEEEGGFYEGVYENGNGFIPLHTANNNGIILAALLYKAQGPILQYRNDNTQVWDTAFEYTDIRARRCMPDPKIVEPVCCNCAPAQSAPQVPASAFQFCRVVPEAGGIAASTCGVEKHLVPPPEIAAVPPQACRAPGLTDAEVPE
ncbi:DUF3131 domain-containing protein [Falsirhodobacter xinxiangensis]|uniref:DUF3131 domain-containing protein n=1 Tax=Falsirhodobacter xinxiangensis TaxID=2530049 RepID=UPI0010A9AB9A|nr:DUF3131 domain-containing protein [Rhodobacter xinxiangensis]